MYKLLLSALLLCTGLLLPHSLRADEITDPARKKMILDALRTWYYNYGRTPFTGFKCDVRSSAIDEVDSVLRSGGDNAGVLKLVRSIKTTLMLNRHGEFTIESGTLALSGNNNADEGARQAIAGVERSLTGVMNMWRPFVFGAYFSGPDSDFKIFDEAGAYTVVAPTNEVTMKINTRFILEELTVGSGGTQVMMRPTFTLSDEGYLVSHIDAKMGEMMNISLGFTYKKIKGAQIPTAIAENVEMLQGAGTDGMAGMKVSMTMTLANHAVLKK